MNHVITKFTVYQFDHLLFLGKKTESLLFVSNVKMCVKLLRVRGTLEMSFVNFEMYHFSPRVIWNCIVAGLRCSS